MGKAEQMILDALQAEAKGALTSIGSLKGKLSRLMPLGTINAALWALACGGHVNLTRHDYPQGMTTRERSRALQVGDVFYNGVALRA